MNKIFSLVNKNVNRVTRTVKTHSPEILVVAGIAGVVTSAVMACKATTKLSDILDEAKDTIDEIHEAQNDTELIESGKYTAEDAKKDLALTYFQTGIKVAKLYGPAVLLGTLSITGILASNNMLRKRNISLAAAYAALDKSYKGYRERVVARFGEDVDHELAYNVTHDTVTVEEPDENGKVKKVKKKIDIVNMDGCSPYAICMTRENTAYYDENTDLLRFFINSQQSYANDLLMSRGDLTLREVYESLGVYDSLSDELKKASLVVGWKFEKGNDDIDNFVKFNVFESNIKNGDRYDQVMIVDFNVDGCIYDRMTK